MLGMGLDESDRRLLREEGEDTRYQIKIVQADLRTINNTLNAILNELIKLNESGQK